MGRSPEQIEDELFVLDAQRGDAEALQALARRWHPRLVGLAYRLVGRPEEAAEVVQESWLAIIAGLRTLDDPARFRSWALRIVARRAADWIGQQRRRRALTERLAADPALRRSEAEPAADPDVDESESAVDRLRRALRRQPPERRALLGLYYRDGLSIREIAEALELPEGTVKTRLYHARRALREQMETRS